MASQNVIGSRFGAAPFVAFNNVPAGTTTAKFVLPAGLLEVEVNAVDPNNPGVTSLENGSGTVLATVNTSMGAIPGWSGTIRYAVPPAGGTFQINVTQNVQCVKVYFDQNDI